MQIISPFQDESLTDEQLEQLYAYPQDLSRAWVRVNFIASADGAISVDGRSGGLGNTADRRVFSLGRDIADVILVGAHTALIEGYHGVKATEVRSARRAKFGLSNIPPVAVVTGRCSVDPRSPLIADSTAPPIIITSRKAPSQRRDALARAGAEIILAGEDQIDPSRMLDALVERGLWRIYCEGGPTLFGSLIEADVVDELCLTIAPMLVAGDAPRVASGMAQVSPRSLRLESVLRAQDALLLRYRRARDD